jgi:hypothetical protein
MEPPWWGQSPTYCLLSVRLQPDFLAVNFYSGAYAYYSSGAPLLRAANTTISAAGVPLPRAESQWLHVFPAAFRALLVWLDKLYGDIPIIVSHPP